MEAGGFVDKATREVHAATGRSTLKRLIGTVQLNDLSIDPAFDE